MAQLLVRDLDDHVMARLEEQARRNRRSLQAEARAVLEAAALRCTKEGALEVFRGGQEKSRGRPMSDSADLIREDRDR
jgi:plasmid stability protein